jgi:glycogen(starch) synthase
LRVLFLSNYYPPYEVGGYEQLCRDVADRLTGRGHAVAVLTSDRGVTQGQEGAEPGVARVLRIQPQFGARRGPAVQFFLTRRQTEAHNRRACRDVIRQFRPDAIFVWNLEGLPHELAVDAEATPGAAVAYWLAGITPAEPDSFWRYWTQTPGKRSSLRSVKDLVSRVALAQMRHEGKPVRPQMRHVAVVSEYMRRKGLAENTLPAHAEVIYNGVETDLFYRPVPPPTAPPPINLLLAGRVSADKGVHVAVEAVGKLAQARPQRDYRLIIAGSGPADYLEQLQRLVASYSVEELVSFPGWLPRERMPDLMRRCHLLLLPTVHQEPFARVTLEGMAAGLAVIGTLTGGTGELLRDGSNGLACKADDSQDLAGQIGRLLNDPPLRHRLASRGQEMVLEQYSMEHMVERVEDLLGRAAAEQGV